MIQLTLESHVCLETTVKQLRVLARPRVVEEVVRAHERSDVCLDGTEERVFVDFTHGPIVNVGRGSLAEVLLLVTEVVFGVCLDTL